jgi:hypothetical protein
MNHTPKTKKRDRLFISYAHADSKWLDRLQIHLRPLEREHLIQRWDDTKIVAGSRWLDEIKNGIDSAKVAVLLVSANFLASDFIATNELPPLLQAAQNEGCIILPVILSPCRYIQTPQLAQFQAVNDPAKTLIEMEVPDRERFFVRLTDLVFESLKVSVPASATGEKQLVTNEQITLPDKDNEPPDTDIEVIVKVESTTSLPVLTRAIGIHPRLPLFHIGEEISILVWASRDCDLTLINIGSAGAASVLLPNPFHPVAKLRAEEWRRIPDESDAFALPLLGPPGVETLIVIASMQPLAIDRTQFNEPGTFARFEGGLAQITDFLAEESTNILGRQQVEFYVSSK